MKLSYKLTLLFSLFSCTFNLLAADTGYEVEMIIFEDAQSRYIQSEEWSYNDMLNNLVADKVVRKSHKDPEYRELDWSTAKLANSLEHIKNNSNYNVLVYKRWKQTGLDRDEAFNIDINSKQSGDITDTDNEFAPYVAGTVKLIMSRYLHFGVNLQYFKAQKNQLSETVYMSYPVVSERRMRSKEIHYIDHPMVGVIVLATPYKIAAKKR